MNHAIHRRGSQMRHDGLFQSGSTLGLRVVREACWHDFVNLWLGDECQPF
jgi:hypothetical protein